MLDDVYLVLLDYSFYSTVYLEVVEENNHRVDLRSMPFKVDCVNLLATYLVAHCKDFIFLVLDSVITYLKVNNILVGRD